MRLRPWKVLAAALAIACAAVPARATSYVPMTDAALADQSPVIALVRIEGQRAPGARAVTEYEVSVEDAIKGAVSRGDRLTVSVIGGTAADGTTRRIFGAPRFTAGRRALLFLSPGPGGTWRPVQLMLGAFHVVETPAGTTAVRDLGETLAVEPGGRVAPGHDAPRDLGRFTRWLRDRVGGLHRPTDYVSADASASPPTSLDTSATSPHVDEPFTQLGNARWFEFDTGGGVNWRAHASGQSGMSGGGFTQFQTALAAWNAESRTPVNLVYFGTTLANGGLTTGDGFNVILWDDPNGEIANSFSCSSGGVLAVGGYSAGGTGTFRGQTFDRVLEGDIVTQDGSGCFYALNGGKNGEEVFAHELGHTLGLGHSCSSVTQCNANPTLDAALMRWAAHGDGRGAALASDDRAGLQFLYEIGGFAVNDVTVSETGSATFTVTRLGVRSVNATVQFTVTGQTAVAGTDFTASSGTLNFTSGTDVTQTINVPIAADTLDEANETFLVTLSNPVNDFMTDGLGLGTIVDNDPAPTISIGDVSAGESGSLPFLVSLSAPSGQTITVSYETIASTATTADFTSQAGILTFTPGVTSRGINVAIKPDAMDEDNETFFVNIGDPVNVTLLDAQAVGTIVDDDPPPTLSINDAAVTEVAGATTLTFTVALSTPSGRTVSVGYATANGTASAGTDYTAKSGTLIFPAGTASLPVVIAIPKDVIDEPAESFTVNLTAPVNATLADAQGAGTILDDDPPPAVSIAGLDVSESVPGLYANVPVSLSAPSGFAVVVSFSTAPLTATPDRDYVAAPGTVTFTPGTTSAGAKIGIVRDFKDEPDEEFTVTLTGASNATLPAAKTVTVAILDDDRPPACTNIETLPYTITAQGRYCLVRNLSTSISTGAAITVNTDFVVLEMRGFKIGGGGAGAGTQAYGVYALNRKNVTVRNGNIRGFRAAVYLQDDTGDYSASQGHLVESVRADDNTEAGIWVEGRGNVVRRNQVVNTGGSTLPAVVDTYGLRTGGPLGRILDNDVADTFGVGAGSGIGIALLDASGAVVDRNRVGNSQAGPSAGVKVTNATNVLVLNTRLSTLEHGVVYDAGSDGKYRGNLASGVATPYTGGTDAGNNQ